MLEIVHGSTFALSERRLKNTGIKKGGLHDGVERNSTINNLTNILFRYQVDKT